LTKKGIFSGKNSLFFKNSFPAVDKRYIRIYFNERENIIINKITLISSFNFLISTEPIQDIPILLKRLERPPHPAPHGELGEVPTNALASGKIPIPTKNTKIIIEKIL